MGEYSIVFRSQSNRYRSVIQIDDICASRREKLLVTLEYTNRSDGGCLSIVYLFARGAHRVKYNRCRCEARIEDRYVRCFLSYDDVIDRERTSVDNDDSDDDDDRQYRLRHLRRLRRRCDSYVVPNECDEDR